MRFEPLLEAVQRHSQPASRAQHLVGTFQQLLALVSDDVALADLAAGWQVLARPHSQQEQASVAHRHEVCAELAAIAARLTTEPGHLAGAVNAWQAWQDACQKSADPRLAVKAKTFARELGELQSTC